MSRNFSALDISQWIRYYGDACQHWVPGSCLKDLAPSYMKCVRSSEPCPMREERLDDSKITEALFLSAQSDYAVAKTLWNELNNRRLRGNVPCVKHANCVFSWRMSGTKLRIKCTYEYNATVSVGKLIAQLAEYERWKQKLKFYQ